MSNNSKNVGMEKFATILPNVYEAANPLPDSIPVFVYDINIWFPVDNVTKMCDFHDFGLT